MAAAGIEGEGQELRRAPTAAAGGGLSCRVCARAFKRSEHLHRHERTHDGARPFSCSICSKSFARSDVLARHVRGHAPSVQPTASTSALPAVARSASPRSSSAASAAEPSPNTHQPLFEAASLGQMEGSTLWPSAGTSSETSRGIPTYLPSPPTDWNPQLFGDLGFADISSDSNLQAFLSFLNPGALDHQQMEGLPIVKETSGTSPTIRFRDGERILEEVKSIWPISLEVEKAAPTLSWTELLLAGSGLDHDVVDRIRNELSIQESATKLETITVPSSAFLITSLSYFWTRTHPLLPILHRPTFLAPDHLALLLLAMCASGASWMGTASAQAFSSSVFQRILQVRQKLWADPMSAGKRKDLLVVEVLMLQYGLYRGQRSWLSATVGLLGSVIANSRRLGLFDNLGVSCFFEERQNVTIRPDMWEEWVGAESWTRLANAILLLDDWIHTIARDQHPPIAFGQIDVAFPASDALFNAPTRDSWAALAGPELFRPSSLCSAVRDLFDSDAVAILPTTTDYWTQEVLLFSIYTLKRCRWMSAFSDRRGLQNRFDASVMSALVQWLQFYRPSGFVGRPEDDVVDMAWHAINLDMHADVEAMSLAAGREGSKMSGQAVNLIIESWCSTPAARRALLHATRIIRLVIRQVGVLDIVPFHLFTAAKVAALVFLFYTIGAEYKHRLALSLADPHLPRLSRLGDPVDLETIGIESPGRREVCDSQMVAFLQHGGECSYQGGEPLHAAQARTMTLLALSRALSSIALDGAARGMEMASMISLWAGLELDLP